ncbi:hypothetical protein BDZ91DRAFT_720981 [Kalaharituber pfeilii]|nr:hypothetical protein BDZ91DRAFT_720981 [Kalaharituber pfeilii]
MVSKTKHRERQARNISTRKMDPTGDSKSLPSIRTTETPTAKEISDHSTGKVGRGWSGFRGLFAGSNKQSQLVDTACTTERNPTDHEQDRGEGEVYGESYAPGYKNASKGENDDVGKDVAELDKPDNDDLEGHQDQVRKPQNDHQGPIRVDPVAATLGPGTHLTPEETATQRLQHRNRESLRKSEAEWEELQQLRSDNVALAAANKKGEQERQRLRSKIASLKEVNNKIDTDRDRWQTKYQNACEEVRRLKQTEANLSYHVGELQNRNKSRYSELEGYQDENQRLKNVNDSQRKQYEQWIAVSKSNLQRLEEEKLGYELQLQKMSKIISRLNKRGLPWPRDDSYFRGELDDLISEIRKWARLFTRGQPPLTVESWQPIYNTMSDQIQHYLLSSFLDLRGLLGSCNVGSRVRTRCVEVILLRKLLGTFLTEDYLGFKGDHYTAYQHLHSSILSTDEDRRLWSALTAHLLSKNTQDLDAQQEEHINVINDDLCTQVAPLGSLKRASKEGLKSLIWKVAKLGLEMAQLPFYIMPRIELKPGDPYEEHTMEDIELEGAESNVPKNTTIILTPAWVKMIFDKEGKRVYDPHDPTCYITKARVSCIT